MRHLNAFYRRLSLLLTVALMAAVLASSAEELPAETEGPGLSEIPVAIEEIVTQAATVGGGLEPVYGRIKLKSSKTIALRKTMTVSTSFQQTGTAVNGELVTVLAEEGDDWAYIRAADGEGYIMTRYMKIYQPGETIEPDPTPTPTKTPKPSPTPRPTPTPKPTPTPEPTLAPLPSYPPPTSYTDARGAFPEEEGEASKVLLSFIGDVTLGSNEGDHKNPRSIDNYIRQYGYEYPFARVKYILEQDDLTIANFEGTFHSDRSGLTELTKKAYNFRAAPELVEVLKRASVEAVALGNNHVGDFGQPGYDETVQVLDDNGIGWFGNTNYGAKGFVFEHNGVKIGFVSCYISYWVINNGEHVPEINRIIEELRAESDVVIAYIHGGVEYAAVHDRNQERFFQYFVRKGADIVIGGHPHCLQGCSIYDGVPMFYSLGNFVFGGNFKFYSTKYNKYIKYTAILQCALSFDEDNRYLGCRFNIIPCRLGEDKVNNQYQPFPVTGAEADECLAVMAVDTGKSWNLSPVIPDIGALQSFIPAKKR